MQGNHDTEIADDEATGQRALEVIALVTSEFDRITSAGELTVNADTTHLFQAIFGWWVRINRSGQLVALAHGNHLGHESGPVVRSIIQHTLFLQWVIDNGDDALDALREHGENNRRTLLDDLARAAWPIPAGAEAERPEEPARAHRLMGMIKNFADLCIAYDARQLYVAYRLLSFQIHPSPQGAMAYLDDADTLSNRAAHQTWGLLIQTAICLIQAARTINPLIQEQPFSGVITRAEDRLGIEIGLWTRRPSRTRRSARRTPRAQGQPPPGAR